MSKILGYAVIVGATMVKFPQIFKILKSKSAKGLVPQSYYTECCMYTITACYNTHIGTPFSVYGESLFLLMQSLVIISLVWEYRPDISKQEKILVGVGLSSFVLYLYSDIFVPEYVWSLVMNSQFLLMCYARLPQILSNFENKSTGQLSVITIGLNFLGSLARLFTVFKEARNKLVYFSTSLQCLFNAVMLIQV